MAVDNDQYVIGEVTEMVSEVMDRLDRERPELSTADREAAAVRIGRQKLAFSLASTPKLKRYFNDMAAEHLLRSIVSEMQKRRAA